MTKNEKKLTSLRALAKQSKNSETMQERLLRRFTPRNDKTNSRLDLPSRQNIAFTGKTNQVVIPNLFRNPLLPRVDDNRDLALVGKTRSVTLNSFQGLQPSRYDDNHETSPTGQINIDRSQSTRQTGSHNSQARWFALSIKFGMTKRCAFTLAEVLITLGIIGIVAALTIPMFMSRVQTEVKLKRIENIKQKLSKVTDKMASLDTLQGLGSTEEFVNEMKKHMSIAKICKNEDIASCWPTSTVDLDNGKNWDINKTKTAKHMKVNEQEDDNWDDTMGIVTADGTSMIISYNKSCSYDVNKDGLKFDKDTGMSNTLTSRCFAIVYDWNGSSRPNKLGDDVLTLGEASGLDKVCAYRLGELCIAKAAAKPSSPMTKDECEKQKTELGIKGCGYDNDYWAGAVRDCGGVSNMFTLEEIGIIATHIYGTTVGTKEDKSGLNFDSNAKAKAVALGLPDHVRFFVWSADEEDDYRAFYRDFNNGSSYWGHNGGGRASNSILALCKGE